MKNQERITILIGSGIMLDISQELSCKSITEKVIRKEQSCFDEKFLLLKFIYEQLKEYHHSEEINFEDIFHTLEMWSSLRTAENPKTVKAYRSVFGILGNVKEKFTNISDILIYRGLNDIIDTVITEIASYEKSIDGNKWFSDFFKSFQSKIALDVFTLNYDTWMEQILEKYNDGFVPISETYQIFSSNKLFNDTKGLPTVNHLHGQICFNPYLPVGLEKVRGNKVYKANNFDIANNENILPKYRSSMFTTQAAEQIYQYPIITGLRKNDKILTPPFDAYYTHLYEKLRNNKKLLIIGYGFGDLYVNSLLSQFRDFHGEDGKVICIDYLDKKKWGYNMADMPFSTNMKHTVYNMFRDRELPHRFLGRSSCDYIDSEDKRSRLYLCGFKNTVSFYEGDIFNFYSI